jgi:(E)-4-hydroxy-3-methylbut-2-enyl-diphosphate synthase
LVADIHYDHRLALRAIEEGVDMLRLNPGNITKRSKIEEIVKSAKDKAIPIRVGVNSGSLPNFKGPKDMVEAALREVEILEGMNFYDIIISLKSPDVPLMLAANRMIADQVDYPLHLGVTEAGFGESGVVKSAVGIGILLEEGIGDTIRVSLTGDPVREVKVAYEILSCLGYRRRGIQITSCPTCGRCEIDLEGIISRLKEKLKDKMDTLNLKVSLMGCAVNGIGEAAHSDIGLVGAKNSGNLYKEGKLVGRVPEERIVDELVRMIKERERERKRERERGGGEAF